jgi:hypothetical protein
MKVRFASSYPTTSMQWPPTTFSPWEGIATATSTTPRANWQFKTADARVKLKRLYPQFG